MQRIEYKKEQKRKLNNKALADQSTLEKMREHFHFVTELMVKQPDYWKDRRIARNKVKEEFR